MIGGVEQLIKMGFDRKSLRLLLDVKTLHSLPIKYATREEIHEAMKSWFYNSIYYYPKYSRKIKNEWGHDEKYRYVLKKERPVI